MTLTWAWRAALLACIVLQGRLAFAQDASGFSGEVTTGIGYQSGKSAPFGRYAGGSGRGGVSNFNSFELNYQSTGSSDSAEHKGSADAAKADEDGKWGFSIGGTTSTMPGR